MMAGERRLPALCPLLFFLLLELSSCSTSISSSSGEPKDSQTSGPCYRQETYNATVEMMVTVQVNKTRYDWCFGGFMRCPVFKIENVDRLQNITQVHTRNVETCCPGNEPAIVPPPPGSNSTVNCIPIKPPTLRPTTTVSTTTSTPKTVTSTTTPRPTTSTSTPATITAKTTPFSAPSAPYSETSPKATVTTTVPNTTITTTSSRVVTTPRPTTMPTTATTTQSYLPPYTATTTTSTTTKTTTTTMVPVPKPRQVCRVGLWGKGCRYECECGPGSHCDQDSGDCPPDASKSTSPSSQTKYLFPYSAKTSTPLVIATQKAYTVSTSNTAGTIQPQRLPNEPSLQEDTVVALKTEVASAAPSPPLAPPSPTVRPTHAYAMDRISVDADNTSPSSLDFTTEGSHLRLMVTANTPAQSSDDLLYVYRTHPAPISPSHNAYARDPISSITKMTTQAPVNFEDSNKVPDVEGVNMKPGISNSSRKFESVDKENFLHGTSKVVDDKNGSMEDKDGSYKSGGVVKIPWPKRTSTVGAFQNSISGGSIFQDISQFGATRAPNVLADINLVTPWSQNQMPSPKPNFSAYQTTHSAYNELMQAPNSKFTDYGTGLTQRTNFSETVAPETSLPRASTNFFHQDPKFVTGSYTELGRTLKASRMPANATRKLSSPSTTTLSTTKSPATTSTTASTTVTPTFPLTSATTLTKTTPNTSATTATTTTTTTSTTTTPTTTTTTPTTTSTTTFTTALSRTTSTAITTTFSTTPYNITTTTTTTSIKTTPTTTTPTITTPTMTKLATTTHTTTTHTTMTPTRTTPITTLLPTMPGTNTASSTTHRPTTLLRSLVGITTQEPTTLRTTTTTTTTTPSTHGTTTTELPSARKTQMPTTQPKTSAFISSKNSILSTHRLNLGSTTTTKASTMRVATERRTTTLSPYTKWLTMPTTTAQMPSTTGRINSNTRKRPSGMVYVHEIPKSSTATRQPVSRPPAPTGTSALGRRTTMALVTHEDRRWPKRRKHEDEEDEDEDEEEDEGDEDDDDDEDEDEEDEEDSAEDDDARSGNYR